MQSGGEKRGAQSLGFEETQTEYASASQTARVWTETWTRQWLYCANCGNDELGQYGNNWPASDFYCPKCSESYELKSKKGRFGKKVIDGSFKTMQERLTSNSSPNFAFLSYDAKDRQVIDLFLVPKQFMLPRIIEERRPLPPTARRAGWVGCNIRLHQLPALGRIDVVRGRQIVSKDNVLELWQRTLFLREKNAAARGWLLEVMSCCDAIGRNEFQLDDVYRFENRLQGIYPENRHVRQKIRQQLQVLRDAGYLEFLGRGNYRLTHAR